MMQLTRENTIRVHRQEITPGQAFAEQAAAEVGKPDPCTPLTRKQIAAQYAEARRWTEAHGPQALCTQLADLLQAARRPMSACRLARLRKSFLAAAKAAGFTPGSAGVPPASRPPTSLELRRQCPTATHAYLVGKGPSLDQLTPDAFAEFPNAPILCCNESIHAVEALVLPNPLFCVQQDTSLAQRCRPGRATWFLSAQAWNAGQGDTYERAVKYTPKELGLKTKNLTARAALCIVGKAGGFEHVHFRAFDACVTGDCGYADSIGESPTKRRKNGRRFVGFCKEIERQATNANLTQHWPTSLPQSPSPQSPITDHQSQMSPPWTVACVLRTGGDFLPDHVLWLQAQCRARIKDPFRFVCLTDLPEIPGVETIPLRHDWPRWWPKIELFRPNLFPGPVAFFDLDMVILRDLAFPDPDTLPNRGIAVHRDLRNRKNIGSALMLWNQGAADFLYTHFADSATDFMRTYKGDQDYIHGSLVDNDGREFTPPWTWASYKWHIKAHGPDGFDIAAFHGKPRPWAVQEPWIPSLPLSAQTFLPTRTPRCSGSWAHADLDAMVASIWDVAGAFAEIGVYRAAAFGHLVSLATRTGRMAHAIDSFLGMATPGDRDGDRYPKGRFSVGGPDAFRELMRQKGHVPETYMLHAGYVPAVFDDVHEDAFPLIIVDIDHYEPTINAIAWAWSRLAPGGLLAMDDYYPGLDMLASKAIDEWLAATPSAEPASQINNQLIVRKPRASARPRIDPVAAIRASAGTHDHAYLVGKGPSLDLLTLADFPIAAAPVFCCNESIHPIEALGLPNPLFCVQQDAAIADHARPSSAIWLLSTTAWYAASGATCTRATPYDPVAIGGRAVSLTASQSLRMMALAGSVRCVHMLAFDACINGDCDYAASIWERPTDRNADATRFIRYAKTIKAVAVSLSLSLDWAHAAVPHCGGPA